MQNMQAAPPGLFWASLQFGRMGSIVGKAIFECRSPARLHNAGRSKPHTRSRQQEPAE
jgi:hypothetical protein